MGVEGTPLSPHQLEGWGLKENTLGPSKLSGGFGWKGHTPRLEGLTPRSPSGGGEEGVRWVGSPHGLPHKLEGRGVGWRGSTLGLPHELEERGWAGGDHP